jgi:hypothetical protein
MIVASVMQRSVAFIGGPGSRDEFSSRGIATEAETLCSRSRVPSGGILEFSIFHPKNPFIRRSRRQCETRYYRRVTNGVKPIRGLEHDGTKMHPTTNCVYYIVSRNGQLD